MTHDMFLSGRLSPLDEKGLKDCFTIFDQDKDGSISKPEVANVMRAFGQNPTDIEIQSIMDEFDTNRNDKIEWEEFFSVMKERMKSPQQEESALQESFKVFDRNGDGTIDISELREVMIKCGDRLTDEQVQEIFNEVDINGDGKIDYMEFVHIIMGK